MRRTTAATLAIAGLLLAGCGGSTETRSSVDGSASATEPSIDDSTAPTSAPATAHPTTIPDPTIFDPNRVGDLLDLSSFALTIDEFHSANGTPSERTTTIAYIKDPLSTSVVSDFGAGGVTDDYVVDGRTYQRNNQNYWYLYESGSLAAPDVISNVLYSDALHQLASAVFVGEETFSGVDAYHFTFDETNKHGFDSYTPENPSPEFEGEFYLTKVGNYVLYAHSRMVAAGVGYELIDEYTETLSSIDALTAITLPDDMLPLKEALDLGPQLAVPMPADGVVDSMINYNAGGIGIYHYQFTSTWDNEAQFIEFYTDMPPTNGWEVTHIGRVKNLDVHCLDGNCVMLRNGDNWVILYFDGSNLHVDYDREHRFVAQ